MAKLEGKKLDKQHSEALKTQNPWHITPSTKKRTFSDRLQEAEEMTRQG